MENERWMNVKIQIIVEIIKKVMKRVREIKIVIIEKEWRDRKVYCWIDDIGIELLTTWKRLRMIPVVDVK